VGFGASRRFAYHTIRVISWLAFCAFLVFAIANALTPEHWWGGVPTQGWQAFLQQTCAWLKSQGKVGIIIVGVLFPVCQKLSNSIGAPWVQITLRDLIEEFRKQVFARETQSDPAHYHRVTLFRRVGLTSVIFWFVPPGFRLPPFFQRRFWNRDPLRGPGSGWLVPVARSGHATKQNISVFLAPDDADNAEGVAGEVWARNRALHKRGLPDFSGQPNEESIQEYAHGTFIPVQWVKERVEQKKPLPRSLYGMPIEIKGKLWGVLVLDSRNPNGIKADKVKQVHRMVAVMLSRLLERIG